MTVGPGERALHATAREFHALVCDTTIARDVSPSRALTTQRAYNFDKGTFHG